MPNNSTKSKTQQPIYFLTKGGNFEGVNIFNGATASVVYICDNILTQKFK